MAGRRTFVAGEILTASNINSFLMNQSVMVFDDEAARTAAIPSPIQGMVAYLKDSDELEKYTNEWVPVVDEPTPTGFTARDVITASDSSFPVPSLASTIVKVTVVGAGGGGGGVINNAGAGGTSTFDAGGAGTVTAIGGRGGRSTPSTGGDDTNNGQAGLDGFTSGNAGTGGQRTITQENKNFGGSTGTGGQVKIAYLDLDGISTVNVTIGAGGAASGSNPTGGPGGDGEVILEYVAG